MAKKIKAKTPCTIRLKQLANGNQSIYLDCYWNGNRWYEFLKLYIVKGNDPLTKAQNNNNIALARKRQAEIIEELNNNKYDNFKRRINKDLIEYINEILEKKIQHGYKGKNVYCSTIHSVICYTKDRRNNKSISLQQIDKRLLLDYLDYLHKDYTYNGRHICEKTIRLKFIIITSVLNLAVKEKLIATNPTLNLDNYEKPKSTNKERIYLTIDELKKLETTEYSNNELKRAFLFSCYTGLRISDITSLKYSNISLNNGTYYISKRIIKVNELTVIPLSLKALQLIDTTKINSDDFVFIKSKVINRNPQLRHWCKIAGINKSISFHSARHTFATIALILGADIYTVSKLLGHTNINTTQIYAKIVDEKKVEVIKLFNNL